MSNQSIIIVDDGPNDQEDPDVMFLTSVTKVHSDDCVFIEEVARRVPTRPATNTLDTFNNGPLNLTKRARRDNQEDKNFPVKKYVFISSDHESVVTFTKCSHLFLGNKLPMFRQTLWSSPRNLMPLKLELVVVFAMSKKAL